MLELENLKKQLDTFRRNVISKAKQNLRKKNSSGKLSDSLDSELKIMPNSFSLSFSMADYAQFVDQGVKGADPTYNHSWKNVKKKSVQKAPNSPFKFKSSRKTIPTKVLDKWVISRGIAPRNDKGQFVTRKSLKYLIARSIHAQGLKPSLFFTKPFQSEFKGLSDDLVKAFGLDVDEFLKYTLNSK